MFYNCNRLESIYVGGDWNTDSVTESGAMFLGCTKLVGEQGTAYDENHVDATRAHIDGGSSNPGYLSSKEFTYAVLSSDQTMLTFYCDEERKTRPGTTYSLNKGTNQPGWSDYAKSVTHVLLDSTFVEALPISTYGWFSGMAKLDSITGINNLNTSSVTDMRRMFYGCKSLKSLDLSRFNTENVKNMWAMFSECDSLVSLDLSSFNTENVTNMARMFAGCDTLTVLDLSSFKTDSVRDMAGMFTGCRSLVSLDLSSFNTINVKYMGWMFNGCQSLLALDVSGFNTPKVTEMEYMFAGCDTLAVLDLRRFNTRNVWNMESMFAGCKHLETINVGRDWSTYAVTESSEMFNGCTHLVGGQGTVYDANFVDAARAHIDGGPDNPGYLTGHVDTLHGDVNGDGEVNIADVNCVIGVILGDPDIYEGRADVNGDGEVTVADINDVINAIIMRRGMS